MWRWHLATGAPLADTVASDTEGSVYLSLGPVTGDIDLYATDHEVYGAAAYGYAGETLATLPDVDGDGDDELVIGAPGNSAKTTPCDESWVFLLDGPADGSLQDAPIALDGGEATCFGGSVASAGDIDGDGTADLVVGAWLDSTYASQYGAAYAWSGASVSSGTTDDADLIVYGDYAGNAGLYLGSAVAAGGDLDGDGFDDLLVGAAGYYESGVGDVGAALVWLSPGSDTTFASAADHTVSVPPASASPTHRAAWRASATWTVTATTTSRSPPTPQTAGQGGSTWCPAASSQAGGTRRPTCSRPPGHSREIHLTSSWATRSTAR